MTTRETVRLSLADGAPAPGPGPVDGPAEPSAQSDLLAWLQDGAQRLLAGLGPVPASLRIKVEGLEIELERCSDGPTPRPVATQASPLPPVDGTAAQVLASAEAAALRYVTAQTVGVFYRCPQPGAAPFVEPGDLVEAGQQVGIVEAMKLMLPVHAESAGRVVAALVPDGTAVEYGERLFSLQPAES